MDKMITSKKKKKEPSPKSTQKSSTTKKPITAGATSGKSTSKISVSFTDKKGKKVNNKIAQKLKELDGAAVGVERKAG